MDFFEVIKNRRSVFKYKRDEVCLGSLDNMIDAAMRAPTWKAKTSFKIIIVKDSDKKEEISKSILNKDNKCEEALKTAPLAAVFIGEPDKSGEVNGKEYYMVDAAIGMEHFVLAATAEGYGTLWIGALDEEKVKETLCIPEEFKVIAMTPIGVPEEVLEHHSKKPVEEYVFMDCFGKGYSECKK